MKILVCGGRTFDDDVLMYEQLDKVIASLNEPVDVIISGHAKGADQLGEEYAKDRNLETEVYPAKWNKYGKSAGYKRNMQMLVEGKPDLVVAFPGGIGTAMMVKIAIDAGVNVLDCREM
jgi:predicted Rossmann-fold nucleotide-binding protein